MKTYSVETMRSFDHRTIAEKYHTGPELMRCAGEIAAREMFLLMKQCPQLDRILFLAGKGNNGGDAFVMAELAVQKGISCSLHLTCSPEELTGDALDAWNKLPKSFRSAVKQSLSAEDFTPGTFVIDGLLGTGLKGEPRGTAAEWIRLVNESKCPVLAIDIPSGLNADTGEAPENTIHADLTVTMAGVKTGMVIKDGPRVTGRIIAAEIGIPQPIYDSAPEGIPLFGEKEARKLLSREAGDSFKNRRGHLLVAGGSMLYPSAPFLSGESALRSGAGLVTVAIPESTIVLCHVPKALIVRRIPDTDGTFSERSLNGLQELLPQMDAVAVGPGLSRMLQVKTVLELFCETEKPSVFDADALNLFSEDPEMLLNRKSETVLTPHPGEMKRLLAAFSITSQDRVSDALTLAAKTNCVVLLKGPRTVVAAPDGRYTLNMSGNAALATAGSGDVLTGICGAMLAAGYPAFESAQLGAFFHGLTGEILSPLGSRGFLADDFAENIMHAFKKIMPVW